MAEYVIVGNGVAAAGCIEGIRSLDSEGRITVISAEKHPVYCRPLISYYLEGKTDIKRIGYRDRDFYDRMCCRVLYGVRAVGIDNEKRVVMMDDGAELPYTALCVATGSSPFVPPFEGLDKVEKKFGFMTLDDALGLEKVIDGDSRVLIVGAGLIGLKCAEGIVNRVGSVTVCDLSDRVLSSILDTECAAMIQSHLEKHGITFHLNDSVSRFESHKAVLRSGQSVDFDVLVLAVGVRANTAIVRDIGAAVNRGIIVDENMRTSLDGIYAAGDCSEALDISSGQKKVMAILPNAYMQGYAAGIGMAGGSEVFDKAIPMNSIGFFGLHVMTAGTYEGELYEEKTETSVRRLYIKDNCLKGFMLVNCGERAGIYTSMIRELIPLSSVNFEILKKVATTAAFSKEIRRSKFGGSV